MNLADFLTETQAKVSEQPAIRFEGEMLTFSRMNALVDALAHGLRETGVKPGDVCALMMPNSIKWAIS